MEGNRLNNAPEWSGAGSAVYEFPTRRAGTASLRGDLSWQSQVFFTPVNDAIETQRAYGLVHLRAAFEPTSRRWEMALYVRNTGNQAYIVGTGNAAVTAFTARPGEPRYVGHAIHPAPLTPSARDATQHTWRHISRLVQRLTTRRAGESGN